MTNPESRETGSIHANEAALARQVVSWSGWGSPVGLGIFLVCLAVAPVLGRFAPTAPWF
jgi:hypothetical protein